ncbi:fumarylacetoacetate hydrolase family protein [Streptomyces sp. WI04-05B]|uniref:fumarylacetoacetate hydrolase family protein n=1 Tax=Streptomyces TaxID=1883 RepID=UPI0029A2F69E|nr:MULTISPECIES: fumarylacetoacetate hydrolase family protein [unclassified Streptomyces]MDX2546986.1 fumarylacetoacetate hydrolase family protein [Streptomyces sp. WI04-05B]MDX2589370.1 fumarylacetoacetate hydrolase family protein [Streptomyces sp. WI04-05A]MDX3748154.1 fumarylacetoacetate hydrolase family protein [Streptomyces sp. AK08-02]
MSQTVDEYVEQKLLEELYADFEDAGLIPLWTQRDDLMPTTPQPAAVAHLWRWSDLLPIEWHQGKTFEDTTPIGPWLVTADDPAVAAEGLALSCEVDGDTVQKADTGDLVFDPAALVAYLSEIITLVPGDVIATGTPGGVGHARKPARYLQDGSVLVTRIEGLGECRNTCRRESR